MPPKLEIETRNGRRIQGQENQKGHQPPAKKIRVDRKEETVQQQSQIQEDTETQEGTVHLGRDTHGDPRGQEQDGTEQDETKEQEDMSQDVQALVTNPQEVPTHVSSRRKETPIILELINRLKPRNKRPG